MATLKKYFIAIIPSPPVFDRVELIKKQVSVSYNNKSALRSPPHITLHLPFEWKEEKEEVLIKALNQFAFGDPIEIELKNYSCFEPKVLFIDVVKNTFLTQLQSRFVQHVKEQLNIFNQANDLRPYHPHVTIAFRDLKKDLFYKAWEEFKNKEFNASFTANEIVLLKHNGKVWEEKAVFGLKAVN